MGLITPHQQVDSVPAANAQTAISIKGGTEQTAVLVSPEPYSMGRGLTFTARWAPPTNQMPLLLLPWGLLRCAEDVPCRFCCKPCF